VDELSMAFILLSIAVIIMLAVSIYRDHKQKKRRKKKIGALAFMGLLLILFGLYELPWGAMELYKITELVFGFNLLQNYFFWTFICILSIAVGYVLYKKGRGRK
jgi:drug/metabolite transporter (DMT)-like permease